MGPYVRTQSTRAEREGSSHARLCQVNLALMEPHLGREESMAFLLVQNHVSYVMSNFFVTGQIHVHVSPVIVAGY